MLKRISVISAALTLTFALALVACGGGGSSSGGGIIGDAKAQAFKVTHRIIGGITFHKSTTSAALLSGFTASAATPVKVGGIDGVCLDTPFGAETTFFNLGRYSDTHCDQNFASFSNDGFVITEAMQATNLKVTAGSGSFGSAGDGEVVVKVNSNPTQLTCSLGANKTCTSSTVINLAANDQLTATINARNGSYHNVRMSVDFQQ
jgi:hypothetical protein